MSKINVIEQEVRANAGRSVEVVEARSVALRERGRFVGKRMEIVLSGKGVGTPQRRNYVRLKLNEKLEAMGVQTKFARTKKNADTATLVIEPKAA